jgi:hypothetical protein
MPKYYIKSGSLELIHSTSKDSLGAAIDSVWQLNDFDTLDEYFYIDERGIKDYISADKETKVIPTIEVMKKAGWNIVDNDQ